MPVTRNRFAGLRSLGRFYFRPPPPRRSEREATAERTSAALQVRKAQGRATGGVAPFGFQFIDGRREWHQGEQETHAAIIEHRAAGLSWAKVADKLNATGRRSGRRVGIRGSFVLRDLYPKPVNG